MCCIELIKKFGWRQQLVSVFTPLAVPLPLDLNDDAGLIGVLMGKGSFFPDVGCCDKECCSRFAWN